MISLFLGQANWRRVQIIGLSVQYIEHGKVRLFVWHMLSMSHVPLDRQDEGIVILRGEVSLFEDMSTQSPSSRRLFEKIEELFK